MGEAGGEGFTEFAFGGGELPFLVAVELRRGGLLEVGVGFAVVVRGCLAQEFAEDEFAYVVGHCAGWMVARGRGSLRRGFWGSLRGLGGWGVRFRRIGWDEMDTDIYTCPQSFRSDGDTFYVKTITS